MSRPRKDPTSPQSKTVNISMDKDFLARFKAYAKETCKTSRQGLADILLRQALERADKGLDLITGEPPQPENQKKGVSADETS